MATKPPPETVYTHQETPEETLARLRAQTALRQRNWYGRNREEHNRRRRERRARKREERQIAERVAPPCPFG